MSIATVFLHNLRREPCPAWILEGFKSDSDKQLLTSTLNRFMRYEQDAGFNEWHIIAMDHEYYIARRFTWDKSWYGTAEQIAARITKYYT